MRTSQTLYVLKPNHPDPVYLTRPDQTPHPPSALLVPFILPHTPQSPSASLSPLQISSAPLSRTLSPPQLPSALTTRCRIQLTGPFGLILSFGVSPITSLRI